MNYVGHALVASKINPTANDFYIYGSMLPDFVGMARTKLNKPIDDTDIARGVALHYATDRIFDQNKHFRRIKSEFFSRHVEFLPRGAARACADPGSEILLDGYVLEIGGAGEMFERVIETVNKSSAWVGRFAVNPQALIELNSKMSDYGAPYVYRLAEFAAVSLQRRLRDRPRLSFSEDLIPRVAEVFEDQQKMIYELAPKMISQTIVGLVTA